MCKDSKFFDIFDKVVRMILAGVFLPVLFCVVFIGTNMDYNEGLKMETVCSNVLLFLIVIPLLCLTIYLIRFCDEHRLSEKSDKAVSIVLLVLMIPLYFFSSMIAREIAFNLPWDIQVVSSIARWNVAEQSPVGYLYYLSIYTNNIPISYILGKLLYWSKYVVDYPLNPEFVWLQVNCMLMTLSCLFACLTVKRVTKNLMVTIVTLVTMVLLIILSPWKIAPYTDTYGMLFPIASIYFYVCYRQSKLVGQKIVFAVLTVLMAGIGGWMKPNLFIVLIAVLIVESVITVADIKCRWKYLLLYVFLAFLAVMSVRCSKSLLIEEIGLDFNPNIEASPVEYFYMGLNEESTGSYNSGDFAIYGEFQFTDRQERDAIILERAFDRMEKRGLGGMILFWLRKMVMTFNDGLFGWRTEVWINSHYEPQVSSNTARMDFLRAIYWNGPYVGAYNTIMQLVWIYTLVGITGLCVNKNKRKWNLVFVMCFLGCFFYQVLFEARARYLFAFLPVIIVGATYGMYQYSTLVKRVKR